MIILFGAPGAGKSLQGQMLAARYGWRWLSAGQLLRDTHDPEIMDQMKTGDLVDDDTTNALVAKALSESSDSKRIVLDGFPRELSQAKWLVEGQPHAGRSIKLAIVLEVSDEEIMERLKKRGRIDDKPESEKERLEIYKENISKVLAYFKQMKVPVIHVSGEGQVGDVHNRIESELQTWQLL